MTGRFAFSRKWGAEIIGGGQARFRLWAPGQPGVFLAAEDARTKHEMGRFDDGWFEIETDAVPVDTGYAFQLSDRMRVPDPAARAQLGDIHGPSKLIDPRAYEWRTADWRGRPWHEAVVYELHTGTFTPEGTFAGIEAKLDHLADLGVTTIELMPLAQFSGQRGWGYDGVLLYAPHPAYGGPNGLKSLIDAAHGRGLMVLLDVVYNHFGPDGNYLHLYAPQFFNTDRHTPWGAAIDYTQRPVRMFFIENALFWLEEYRFDGLRLDAIDQIHDSSSPSILEELAVAVRAQIRDRHIHLTTEDGRNVARLHQRDADGQPRLYTAEWNDDFHNVAHVLATGEADGYYVDYQHDPTRLLARALAEGFVYQGEPSPFFGAEPRGEPSAGLPPAAFVDFLQNHDQVGNRAFGDRLDSLAAADAVEALTAILLLSPHIPLLFMGEEWGETRPFYFFTDFHGGLGDAVREGRRNEFARWSSFQDAHAREQIPDPNALTTFQGSKLDWSEIDREPGRGRLALVKRLLDLRLREISPRLQGVGGHSAMAQDTQERAIRVIWRLGDGARLWLTANLSDTPQSIPASWSEPQGGTIFTWPESVADDLKRGELPPWSVLAGIAESDAR